ncbi:ABC transporter substrate-binding protein [Nocardioides marmoriginsengisoli]|uniref:ABC transporter substrate-binding protein n=1 Tax=Nocardioides marmoriginsengisoli TaxID=661483 RepID=A0A3N0CGG1_9ACTN|nr:ABC transporter substrate-binding protein [Nocardioides marmoriginsengisoli]RNL62527.1 ABC transporter substrate-binding protein [Nocardioides marmoriginsengisoli]
MKKSISISMAAVLAATIGLSACSSDDKDPDKATLPSAGAESAACQGEPKTGGKLVAAKQNETLSLSPYNTPGGFGDTEAINMIFEGLVRMDPTGATQDIVPAIAEKWTVAPDGKSYTFNIRSNAAFSNGDPVTAADVKYSLDTWADPEKNSWATFAAGYKGTTVIDPATVRIDLSEPTGGFLYSLAMISASILPEKLAKAQGADFFEKPIGSGPFQVATWNKGSSISYTRNEHYWEEGVPKLDEVLVNFVTDDNTRMLALRSGEAQLVDSVPFAQVTSLQKQKDVKLDALTIASWILLSINNKKPQFKDVQVRQALSLAIDREGVNKSIYSGLGELPNSALPRLKYDAPDSEIPPTPYDVEKAKSLIAGSDFADGFKARLEFPSGNAAFQSLALVLQSAWAEIGVELTLHPEDQATLSKSFNGGTYDLILPYAFAASDVPIPDEFGAFYAIPGGTNGFFTWWADPAIEALTKTFVHTTDEASRAEQWPKIQAALLEQQPAINVLDLPLLEARQQNVCDFKANATGNSSLGLTWIAG